jgi:NitT/TauT family transport system ATP-binding protein
LEALGLFPISLSPEPNVTKSDSLKAVPIVEFRRVSVRFGAFTAIRDISLSVLDAPNRGEFVTVIGPSGCGKSTLLNLVAGFVKPTEGEVLVMGKPVLGPGRDRGMIFQQYSSFPHLTVLQNVMFGLKINNLENSRGARRDRAEHALEQVELTEHRHKYPDQLSGGQQQRVAIARSLVMEPQILLMDEPFSALDEPTRMEMQELIVQLWNRIQPTIVCVTHNVTEAVYLGERVWIFTHVPGQVAYDISSDTIPHSAGIPPMVAQEQPEFKHAVFVVTEAFRRVSENYEK